MVMYTFHLCKPDGASPWFEAHELPNDGATLAKAADLLDDHLSCDHIEVWQDTRAVVTRHRDQPLIRPVREMRFSAANAL